jgi:DNA-binding IclR family transcriptional regulator
VLSPVQDARAGLQITSRIMYERLSQAVFAKAKRKLGMIERRTTYSAPALEKGMDILELLANERLPMSLPEIGKRLGRSKSELFRMIMVLLDRGYIARDKITDGFVLTSQLFELGMRTPPVRDLLDAALPEMQKLAYETHQSTHLVVPSHGETIVIASVTGGSDVSFSLRLGYRRPLIDATSGRLILAFQAKATSARWIAESRDFVSSGFDFAELKTALVRIRQQGFEIQPSRDVLGITDIGCPVVDRRGDAIAALVVPYVNRVSRRTDQSALLRAVQRAASSISGHYGQ